MDEYQYKPDTFENDFVILQLESALEFNDDVQPVCLPSSNDFFVNAEKQCFISGWGALKQGKYSNPSILATSILGTLANWRFVLCHFSSILGISYILIPRKLAILPIFKY